MNLLDVRSLYDQPAYRSEQLYCNNAYKIRMNAVTISP